MSGDTSSLAQLFGVRVDVFSIGFGPRLWGVQARRHRLSHQRAAARRLCAHGRRQSGGRAHRRSRRVSLQAALAALLIAVAGPAMNILLTFAIFWGIIVFKGAQTPTYFRQSADCRGRPTAGRSFRCETRRPDCCGERRTDARVEEGLRSGRQSNTCRRVPHRLAQRPNRAAHRARSQWHGDWREPSLWLVIPHGLRLPTMLSPVTRPKRQV